MLCVIHESRSLEDVCEVRVGRLEAIMNHHITPSCRPLLDERRKGFLPGRRALQPIYKRKRELQGTHGKDKLVVRGMRPDDQSRTVSKIEALQGNLNQPISSFGAVANGPVSLPIHRAKGRQLT